MSEATVFIIASITADGFIAEHTEQFADWSSKEDKKLFYQRTKEAGVMVMGSTTFELFPNPLPGRKHVVLTRSPDTKAAQENVEFTSQNPEAIVGQLTSEGFEKIAIIGGRQIYDAFLKSNLVDELYLVVEPLLFGDGVKLLQTKTRQNLKLIETTKLNDDTIMLHYKIEK